MYKQYKQLNKEVVGYIQCPHCGRFQQMIRLFIYNRDKFTCQKCGTKQKNLGPKNFLTRHHIIGRCYSSTCKVETIINNITWCWECHKAYNKRTTIFSVPMIAITS
ncbi:MAG: HNH endonuclease [Candidatus Helarchaeota archaeon]